MYDKLSSTTLFSVFTVLTFPAAVVFMSGDKFDREMVHPDDIQVLRNVRKSLLESPEPQVNQSYQTPHLPRHRNVFFFCFLRSSFTTASSSSRTGCHTPHNRPSHAPAAAPPTPRALTPRLCLPPPLPPLPRRSPPCLPSLLPRLPRLPQWWFPIELTCRRAGCGWRVRFVSCVTSSWWSWSRA